MVLIYKKATKRQFKTYTYALVHIAHQQQTDGLLVYRISVLALINQLGHNQILGQSNSDHDSKNTTIHDCE